MKSKIHEIQKSKLKRLITKSILILALIAGTIFTSCKSAQQKEATAKQNVVNANQDLKDTKISNANDWLTFKAESQAKIVDNEQRISKLKIEMKKPGKTFDDAYKKSINDLVDKNSTLKTRIADYENNQNDWDTFKREVDSDMEGLGKALNDLTVNNKK